MDKTEVYHSGDVSIVLLGIDHGMLERHECANVIPCMETSPGISSPDVSII